MRPAGSVAPLGRKRALPNRRPGPRARTEPIAERWFATQTMRGLRSLTETQLPSNVTGLRFPFDARAAEANDLNTSVVFAGECVDLIRDVKPVAAIVATLVREAEAALASNLGRRG